MFAPRAVDEGADLALANDRCGKHRLAGCSRPRARTPRQRRLVNLDGIAFEQACIGRNDVAEAQSNDVTRHQFTRERDDPLAVAKHSRLDRELGLQRVDGLSGLVLFGKSDYPIRNEQDQDDEESGQCRSTPDRITAISIIQGWVPRSR